MTKTPWQSLHITSLIFKSELTIRKNSFLLWRNSCKK